MSHFINEIYVYCTDFIINLANILNSSYYEINTLVFCFLYPLILIGLTAIYFWQRRRLKNVKAEYSKTE